MSMKWNRRTRSYRPEPEHGSPHHRGNLKTQSVDPTSDLLDLDTTTGHDRDSDLPHHQYCALCRDFDHRALVGPTFMLVVWVVVATICVIGAGLLWVRLANPL